ncbi:hypothetical protein DJ90_6545 [Paenibacillus macerans]|uniref:Uncharacterized protein n=1 Tax=Paenibacillus macerans TaxID=44252 RepID=A0A090ZMQ8_PAEMA|nr:hypothetical protein DJ90_6545 [Paenibacillus macerans]
MLAVSIFQTILVNAEKLYLCICFYCIKEGICLSFIRMACEFKIFIVRIIRRNYHNMRRHC